MSQATMSSPSAPSTPEPTTDPRLAYTQLPTLDSVSSLLQNSLTEVFSSPPPLAPPVVNPSPSTTNLCDQAFIVKQDLLVQEQRALFTTEYCSCIPSFRSTSTQLTSWDLNSIISRSSHHVHIPVLKSNLSKSELTNSKHHLTKSSSTSKLEGYGKFRGYPYEKMDIRFPFQHTEIDDKDALYSEMYRQTHTYPCMEDKLRAMASSESSLSYSAPSVIEPKLMTFGVSKPGLTGHSNKQSHRVYASQALKRSHQEPAAPVLDGLTSKSATIVEVFHGQSITDRLGTLPHPASPPTAHRPMPKKKHTIKKSPYAVQFKDIINISETQCLKSQKKPSVRWASHKFPANLVSGSSQDPLKVMKQSPKQRRQRIQPANAVEAPRGKPKSLSQTKNVHFMDHPLQGLFDFSSTSISKPKPKEPQNENKNQMLTKNISQEQLRKPARRRNRSSPLSLMPTSKALVPSLGIYSRTALAQRSVDYF